MELIKAIVLCSCIILIQGEEKPVEQLPPVLKGSDDHGHLNPVLTESVLPNSNLLGKPDGHENVNPPVIGQPDGHDGVRPPAIGQPDGHDGVKPPMIGQPDGHDGVRPPVIGQPDGHDGVQPPMIGQPDGHEQGAEEPLFGREDDHEPYEDYSFEDEEKMPQLGRPDGHERAGTDSQESRDSSSEEAASDYDDWYDETRIPSVSDEEYEEDYDDYDHNKPLVRCTRPLCDKFCPIGFQTDDKGCPVCDCLLDPCQSMKCGNEQICRMKDCPSERNCKQLTAECVDDDAPPCAMPMCANYCEHGYHYDSRGCMNCECALAPSNPPASLQKDCPQVDCVTYCSAGYVTDENGCTTCTCKHSGESEKITTKYPCAIPMCMNWCEKGYELNEYGCQTCDCVGEQKQKCGPAICQKDEICRKVNFDGSEEKCVPKPLCLAMKEGGNRLTAPRCEEDSGKFTPLQCDRIESECWCVDDRGVVIDGTKTSVYIDEHKPRCPRNVTVAATIHMILTTIAASHPVYDHKYSTTELLTRNIPIGLSSCSLIHKGFISVNKVTELTVDDTSPEIGRQYYTEVMVRNDGVVDLPSALDRLMRRTQVGDCKVGLENGAVLEPAPETLSIEPKFSHIPHQPLVSKTDSSLSSVKGSRLNTHMLLFIILLSVMILLSIVLIGLHMVRRRRLGQNFEHQRLESQISSTSEKNLLDGRDDNVLLINNEPIAKKTAFA